jgi:ABC-type branched-subunit amino acid transport system ATPase component
MIARPQGFRHGTGGDRVSPPLLELRNLSKAFGGLTVIDELDLEVADGEIVSVIGPNGAGKTTLFNLITGLYLPDSGDLLFQNRSIRGRAPHAIAKLGIARTFQTLRLFLHDGAGERDGVAIWANARERHPVDPAYAGLPARGT